MAPSQKQRKNPSAFKKLLDKRPTEKADHETLEKPDICYSKAVPTGEGCSYQNGANEIEELMSLSLPSFMITMLPSHVSNGYWLGLPKRFCVKHLPKNNDTVTLVDDDGRQQQVKYLSARTAFSGGWKAFAQYHSLEVDDELFFELIKPCTLKVDIMRIYGTAGVVSNSAAIIKEEEEEEEEDGDAEM